METVFILWPTDPGPSSSESSVSHPHGHRPPVRRPRGRHARPAENNSPSFLQLSLSFVFPLLGLPLSVFYASLFLFSALSFSPVFTSPTLSPPSPPSPLSLFVINSCRFVAATRLTLFQSVSNVFYLFVLHNPHFCVYFYFTHTHTHTHTRDWNNPSVCAFKYHMMCVKCFR